MDFFVKNMLKTKKKSFLTISTALTKTTNKYNNYLIFNKKRL